MQIIYITHVLLLKIPLYKKKIKLLKSEAGESHFSTSKMDDYFLVAAERKLLLE